MKLKSGGQKRGTPVATFCIDLRRLLGISQKELAGMAGVTVGTVSNWERGKGASPEHVAKLQDLRKEARQQRKQAASVRA